MTTFDKLMKVARVVIADERIAPAIREEARKALESAERDRDVQKAAEAGYHGKQVAAGVVCKCDDPKAFCPAHGREPLEK